MRFSVAVPSCMEGLIYPYPFADPRQIVRISTEAESMGYEAVWPNDHITTQNYVARMWPKPPRFYEPFVLLSFVAAATKRIKLATGVAVLPVREPIILAKQAATLDVCSGGRVILGVGLGAYREEFRAANPGKAPHRGKLMDERIAALRELLGKRKASFEGRYVRFRNVEMYPKPIQKNLPIYIGGNSWEGVERAARFADGWFPAILTPQEVADRVKRMARAAKRAGRSFRRIDIAPQLGVTLAKTEPQARRTFLASQLWHHLQSLRKSTLKDQRLADIGANNLVGTAEQVIDRIGVYREAGVTHLAGIMFGVNSVRAFLNQMEFFAARVMPAFRSR
ncbi:MAG: LLM class flavin-dependent oxidoreductase [Nitrospinota bacterium]